MYPYDYYYGVTPQQVETHMPFPNPLAYEHNDRQQPQQLRPLERRVTALERQNELQVKEITRLNNELRRQNQEINRVSNQVNQLNQTVDRHTKKLNRLNQRLRAVENRLTIPFTPVEDGF